MISDIEALKKNEILNHKEEPRKYKGEYITESFKLKDLDMVKISFHGKAHTRYIVDVEDGKFYVSEV